MNQDLYIRASSILETVIAITIITICSLIATLVYTNVIQQTPPIKKYKYTFEMEKAFQKAIVVHDLASFKKTFDGHSIEKRIDLYGSHEGLKKVRFLLKSKSDTVKYSILLFNTSDTKN